jgi:anti-anti-sigma factor
MPGSEKKGDTMFLAEHTKENVLYLKFTAGTSRLQFATTEALKKEIIFHMQKCCKNIYIDLEDIHFIDAKSFEELAALSKTAKEEGITITLCNVSDETFELISLMQMSDVLVSSGHPYEVVLASIN